MLQLFMARNRINYRIPKDMPNKPFSMLNYVPNAEVRQVFGMGS
jgi:hypothetical protein